MVFLPKDLRNYQLVSLYYLAEVFIPMMISLGDPRLSNPVLSALQLKLQDKIIAVRENSNADSNFVLTHLIKQFIYEKNKICLVNLHNTVEHYQTVGKKLGYNLLKAEEENNVRIIDPIKNLVENIGLDEDNSQADKENIVKCLYFDIKKNLEELLSQGEHQAYLIIDDLSHLIDLGVELTEVLTFMNYCVNLVDERISIILNNHVASKIDEIVSNSLQYIADVHIDIAPLKTGHSLDITGLMTIERLSEKRQLQFKAFDRGIKTFHPGESIYHLYK